MLAVIAVIIMVLGLVALNLGRRLQAETGLPAGRVVYADTEAWRAVNKPLYSPLYHLAGKPDYVVKANRQTIPVEVKAARAPANGPRRSHLLQLAAYGLLVTEAYRQRPDYGIVAYADQAFEVEFTPVLERAALDTLAAMRADLARGEAHRSHHEAGRCVHCGYRDVCPERLA